MIQEAVGKVIPSLCCKRVFIFRRGCELGACGGKAEGKNLTTRRRRTSCSSSRSDRADERSNERWTKEGSHLFSLHFCVPCGLDFGEEAEQRSRKAQQGVCGWTVEEGRKDCMACISAALRVMARATTVE
ncbi:hypothetical protein MPTK1_7g18670 [Marchantia polymorpha subsp. ruderalis]|uniref:Uncharacterized protein n=2 Tax=Marchantia polymorpha TaxID=3197 RepID=A0AAF6C164_MARPO|nr:hypothetical protein MARPO_0165s0027 [Marchantia polymorpha]BBN17998.1 hypothetical protein Mp_7g18670 [Marchantia polymorpha subsp. ruderalis]|eukprot:PTQ28400.1 hypothetical protein MARPO_0165s0027 [Marchantia polymorpha]